VDTFYESAGLVKGNSMTPCAFRMATDAARNCIAG